jgi:hypothetical protein
MGELKSQTSGSLRIARRQQIQSGVLAKKSHNRLELEENGDKTIDGVYNRSASSFASAFQTARMIEKELDRRGEEYEPEYKVRKKFRNRI